MVAHLKQKVTYVNIPEVKLLMDNSTKSNVS